MQPSAMLTLRWSACALRVHAGVMAGHLRSDLLVCEQAPLRLAAFLDRRWLLSKAHKMFPAVC